MTAAEKPIFEHPNSLKIFGPAGAGKTREVVETIRDHVDEGDFDLSEAIVLSFTRAAANDIAKRVTDGAPGRYHTTIHALCKRYYGFDREIAEPKLGQFFKDLSIEYKGGPAGDGEEWAVSAGDRPTEGSLLVWFFNMCRNRLLTLREGLRILRCPPELVRFWSPERMQHIWDRYVAWKTENKLVDFTDMLEYALQNPPQQHWACFVLDEAQDSTPLQWAVANLFAARSEVAYLAGDDDQAIYNFAGASSREFLSAVTPNETVLRTNYRSGAEIVDAAQTFIRRNKDRKDKDTRSTRAGAHVNSVRGFDFELSLDESTFLMARANYLLEPVQVELQKLAYPFVDRRGRYGVTGSAATAYERFRRLALGQRLTLDEWRLLIELIPSNGPWLDRGIKKRLREMDPDQRRTTFVGLDRLGDYGALADLTGAIKQHQMDPLVRINRDQAVYLKGVADRYGAEYLEEARAREVLQTGPIHAFKGLECDHAIIHDGMPPAATREAVVDAEPERRVFYVAMTRPRNRLTWISGPAFAKYQEVL